MKTVRFTHVVEQSGRPQVYLLLTDPAKDAHFQQALRADRLMTVQNAASGSKTDFGTVGYLPKTRGEVLVFPRSLKAFADAKIVGINYDLLEQEREPERQEPEPESEPKPAPAAKPKPVNASQTELGLRMDPHLLPKPKQKLKPKPVAKAKPEPEHKPEPPPEPKKVLPFSKSAPLPVAQDEEEEEDENEDDGQTQNFAEIKAEIRRALKALEAGKQVVAFNILKKILE